MTTAPDVGFALSPAPAATRDRMIHETRQLFIVLGLFLGVVIGGFVLLKNGLLHSLRVEPLQAGLVVRKEANWQAPSVGAIEDRAILFPTEKVTKPDGDWYRIDRVWLLADGARTKASGWFPAEAARALEGGFGGAYVARRSFFDKLWIIATISIILGIVAARLLVPVYEVWMKFVVGPLGWFNTRLLLTLVFFVALAPLAIIRRLASADPLDRAIDKQALSYWHTKQPLEKGHFERSF